MAKKPRKDRRPPREPGYDIEGTVSAAECTGIAPAPVLDEGAVEACAGLYAIHRPKVDEEAKEARAREERGGERGTAVTAR